MAYSFLVDFWSRKFQNIDINYTTINKKNCIDKKRECFQNIK